MTRRDYCPISNGPRQSLCDTSCGSHKFTDAEVDQHLDAVLKASGSALRYYTMQKSMDDMRAAMRRAMNAPTACSSSYGLCA